jgi:hypothetical protein
MSQRTQQRAGDYFTLAGKRSPGIADVTGAASRRKWDIHAPHGHDGAASVYRGLECSKFSIKIRLYGDPHKPDPDWQDWFAFEPIVMTPPSRQMPRMLDIWHPYLERLRIKSVGVVSVSQPEQTGDGEWTITIELVEFRQPKLALAKPASSKSEASQDPWDRQIDALIQRAHEEAAK